MATPPKGLGGLKEAQEFLGQDDLDFVLDGIKDLSPPRAFALLDGLREIYTWDLSVHLALIEHVLAEYDRTSFLN